MKHYLLVEEGEGLRCRVRLLRQRKQVLLTLRVRLAHDVDQCLLGISCRWLCYDAFTRGLSGKMHADCPIWKLLSRAPASGRTARASSRCHRRRLLRSLSLGGSLRLTRLVQVMRDRA